MLLLRIIHHFRTAAFLLVLTVILGAVGTLLWANYIGMPKSWRQAAEKAIAEHGIHVEIGGLSYLPFEGVVARDVRVFDGPEREQVISRLEGIILDLDNTKLAKGEFQLSKIKLSKARLVLPIDPNDPESESLEITNIEGEFIPPGNRHIEIRNARGFIEGVEVVLNARIADDAPEDETLPDPPSQDGQRQLLSRIADELKQWTYDSESPPQIHIQCVGRRSELDQALAKISFRAKSLEKNQHRIDQVSSEAELRGNILTIHSLTARNGKKRLRAHLDYDLEKQSGRFDVKSNLEIPELLQSWFGVKPLNKLTIAGSQELDAAGEFTLKEDAPLDFRATGYARCESAHLSGIHFDQLETSFSWQGENIFFKDLLLVRPDGEIAGKAMIEGDMVRLDLDSTLLPEFYRPLFIDKPVEEIIDNFATREGSWMELKIEGGFDRRDPKSWAYAGTAAFRNIDYRGVALKELNTTLSMSSAQLSFTDGAITFDYSNYPMAKRFEGPDEGSLKFDSVRYHRTEEHKLTFEGVEGNFWPAPLTRMFLTKTADHLEKYAFHHPPKISGKGSIYYDNKENTLIELDFSSNHSAEYVFLDAPVTMSRPSGKVTITNERTRIDNLKFNAFDGPVVAQLDFPREKALKADIQLTRLSMNAINSLYGMKMECGGEISGNVRFSMMPSQVATMQGSGDFLLEKAELFSVPIFGPLSNLMQAVLNDKRAGAERAKDASCNFVIKNGVVASDDFQTSTKSLVFAGEGWVDLDKQTMDMTMRMNARGFFGLITLPFRPFYGFFQFRGTGPLSEPKWERVAFTKPNDKVRRMLEKDPE